MLGTRRTPEVVPNYSLTGDLLSYLRCGLQYRYQNGSSLPPSRPVQMWFGEFIHGVMETAYRLWRQSTTPLPFPWPCTPTPYYKSAPEGRPEHDIGSIGDLVEATLAAAGKSARSATLRESAYRRAERAVNEVGPALFPLIESAEEKVIGTRPITMAPGLAARGSMYELHGVMDVLSSISMKQAADSFIRDAVLKHIDPTDERVDVIVDYKGSRRPPTDHKYWDHGNWQLQMYAWLRSKQPGARPVAAGVLLYINELDPGSSDIADLQIDVKKGRTDVAPDPGSPDGYQLRTWTQGAEASFSREFRLARMMRVVKITPESMERATTEFDRVVTSIEASVAKEAASGRISGNWAPSCEDGGTCVACDFRHFCPSPIEERGNTKYVPGAPSAP